LGFFNVISRKPFELPKLGEPFGIMRAFTKRFPLGQYSQTVAEAAAQVRSFFANTDEIQEVNIRVSQNAIKVMAGSPDKWRPQSHETADHSMPYAAAVVLMLARKHLPTERIDALLQQLWTLEDMPKVGTLVEMTRV
jgi:2-methylcitrate dehydratase